MKHYFKIIKNFLPESVKKWVEKRALDYKLKKHRERKERFKVSFAEIENVLANFSFDFDFIIHSSISNIGSVENSGQLAKLILSKVDLERFTVLAPALPFLGSVKEYLENLELFDLANARNAMGKIPNQIMKLEGCKRSFHPSHSCIALGKRAAYYTIGHENDETPFGKESPFYKLTLSNGKILMFGVGLNSVTNFHVYEDLMGDLLPFKVYDDKVYSIPSKNEEIEKQILTRAHNPSLSAIRDCERARKKLIEKGYIRTFGVGASEISLLDAKGLTIVLLEMLLEGLSIYGKACLNELQVAKVKDILEELK
ncbi:MAG: hypothetical protein Kow0029_06890 [Candidatus Rifleibacteriota bacterium]